MVPLTTLDALLASEHLRGLSSVDVVKLDVEGAECVVLAGGRTLFTRYRPILILTEGKLASTRRCAAETAAAYNYTIYQLRDRDHNWLWVRNEQSLWNEHGAALA